MVPYDFQDGPLGFPACVSLARVSFMESLFEHHIYDLMTYHRTRRHILGVVLYFNQVYKAIDLVPEVYFT